MLVKIKATTNKAFPGEDHPYEIVMRALVKDTNKKTLEAAVYGVFKQSMYGTITSISAEEITIKTKK